MGIALASFLITINSSEGRTVKVCFIYLLVFVEISVYNRGLSKGDKKKIHAAVFFFSFYVYRFLLLMLCYSDNVLGVAVSQEH